MGLYVGISVILLFSGTVNSRQIDGGELRIVHGAAVSISNFPYMVSLHDSGGYFCGGAILNSCHILTSGGCVYEKEAKSITIRAGSSYVDSSGAVYRAGGIRIHPKFKPESIDYNVAVIRTETPLPFCPNIRPIPLAEREPEEGTVLSVAGWGELQEGGDLQSKLHFARVEVINTETCALIYDKTFNFTDRMFCTYMEQKGTCHGDNGGPAVHNNRIVGVISHRFGCGVPGVPDVYTKVADPSVRRFIRSQIYG